MDFHDEGYEEHEDEEREVNKTDWLNCLSDRTMMMMMITQNFLLFFFNIDVETQEFVFWVFFKERG